MVTVAAQVHAPSPAPRTITDHDRHMMDYFNGLKIDKLVSLKREKEIDSMFKNLTTAATVNEAQKIRVEIWKELNTIWAENTRHMRQKEGFLYRDSKWKDRTHDRYTYLTRKVAGADDTERLWRDEMAEHIKASNAVYGATREYVSEHNTRVARTTGTVGFIIGVGKIFGVKPKPVVKPVFNQSISPNVEDFEQLRRLEEEIDRRIRVPVETAVSDEIRAMSPEDLKKFRKLSPEDRAEEINDLRKAKRNELLWAEMQSQLKNPALLHAFYRATFDSHYGVDLDTTVRRPLPPVLRRDLGTKLADALMNFPDPFKNFTYRNIMNWIDEKIK